MTHQAGQPRDRRGTVGHAYSALNLRLIMASFGLVAGTALAVLMTRADQPLLALIAVAVVVASAVDLVIVLRRRRIRRRQDPGHRYSLFE
ncbi:DUF6343 family protein [Phytohabitans rumicis]|uniref:Uncharacterized protein n=1 Tax=Phytohabitans rumicis TaxID=1076125 RepID=A0A6V8LCH4_9ACTN|nr:DUF6343 family protein [Phytohabitans rumicis]GFJ92698.1 hypothetical protein Prum_063400 [Phytohabitans rumicis]